MRHKNNVMHNNISLLMAVSKLGVESYMILEGVINSILFAEFLITLIKKIVMSNYETNKNVVMLMDNLLLIKHLLLKL